MFLGAPGSGKGTYCRRLSVHYRLPTVSSGELLRSARGDPKFGPIIKHHQDKGVPVPDDVVMPILRARLTQPDCKKGAIFDGLTYNIAQAIKIDEFCKIDLVINLVLPDFILIEKALGRRICSECGDPSYNVSDIMDKKRGIIMPPLLPKVPGKCDKCGGKLIVRADDTEETIKKRLEVYKERIAPVLKFYRNKGVVKGFRVNNVPDLMVPKLINLIKNSVDAS